MSEKKLKTLKFSRKYVRGQVTSICNHVRDNLDNYNRTDKFQTLTKLKAHLENLKENDDVILDLLWDEEKTDDANETIQVAELQRITEYNDRLKDAISIIEASFPIDNGQVLVPQANNSRLKPKNAPLPKYSGEGSDSFERFFLTFEALVNSYGYTNFEKYLLLKECCTDTALTIVDSLEISDQNYTAAKNLLQEALASPIKQKFNTLQRLINLNLDDVGCPYKFVGEIRSLTELFRTLPIDVDNILQFFFWRSMNDRLRGHLVHITNSNYPTLAQIENNIFSSIERYEMTTVEDKKQTDKTVSRPNSHRSTNYAITVQGAGGSSESGGSRCPLCAGSHK